jgi:hypothetical protein
MRPPIYLPRIAVNVSNSHRRFCDNACSLLMVSKLFAYRVYTQTSFCGIVLRNLRPSYTYCWSVPQRMRKRSDNDRFLWRNQRLPRKTDRRLLRKTSKYYRSCHPSFAYIAIYDGYAQDLICGRSCSLPGAVAAHCSALRNIGPSLLWLWLRKNPGCILTFFWVANYWGNTMQEAEIPLHFPPIYEVFFSIGYIASCVLPVIGLIPCLRIQCRWNITSKYQAQIRPILGTTHIPGAGDGTKHVNRIVTAWSIDNYWSWVRDKHSHYDRDATIVIYGTRDLVISLSTSINVAWTFSRWSARVLPNNQTVYIPGAWRWMGKSLSRLFRFFVVFLFVDAEDLLPN